MWQGGTVGWYQRHLHSWDRGQLMAGGGGGPVAGKEPDTPAPPGMSGHQLKWRVTGGVCPGEAPQSELQSGEATRSQLECQVTGIG